VPLMTLMTVMTMKCRGSLNGVAAPSWELEGAVMGRGHGPQGGGREPSLDQLHEGRATLASHHRSWLTG
jgi:hypothetical protein